MRNPSGQVVDVQYVMKAGRVVARTETHVARYTVPAPARKAEPEPEPTPFAGQHPLPAFLKVRAAQMRREQRAGGRPLPLPPHQASARKAPGCQPRGEAMRELMDVRPVRDLRDGWQ